MSGWISVNDRLPDEPHPLLEKQGMKDMSYVIVTDRKVAMAAFYHQKFGFGDTRGIPLTSITHWMPLPKAPEES